MLKVTLENKPPRTLKPWITYTEPGYVLLEFNSKHFLFDEWCKSVSPNYPMRIICKEGYEGEYPSIETYIKLFTQAVETLKCYKEWRVEKAKEEKKHSVEGLYDEVQRLKERVNAYELFILKSATSGKLI